MSQISELTEEQKNILEQFRSRMNDQLDKTHDDYFLLRWLRARKWNIDAAEKMLRSSFKTRAMWNVKSLHNWDAPKVLKDYLPYGMVGYDQDGSPVIVVPFYNFDIYGMLHCVTRFDFIRYVVKLLENFLQLAYDQSQMNGIKARQLVVLFDMDNFNMKQYAWRPAAEFVISMLKQYEQNYPEILKICYIINAPKLFSVAFNIVKKFLDADTINKINIYKIGCNTWQKDMFSHIDPKIIPKAFGGTCIEDANENSPFKVTWGGNIPKELYVDQTSIAELHNKDFIETVVSKGHKLKIEFDVNEEQSQNDNAAARRKQNPDNQILSWNFRTTDYDIKFGIYSIDKLTGEKHSEVDLGTVQSNVMDEIGFINTRPNTKYIVVFDNTNSYLRSKKLRYCISLVNDNPLETNFDGESTDMIQTDNLQIERS